MRLKLNLKNIVCLVFYY